VAAERNSHSRNGEELMLTTSYEQYRKLGGILDPDRFMKLSGTVRMDCLQTKICITQITTIALAAKIDLDGASILCDETIAVYKVLRMSTITDAGAPNPVRMLSDEQILADALRIVADVDSLGKLSQAFPHI
jgi:hypothetical protein